MRKKDKKTIALSEKEVLEKLDIPNFRHMSKDKIMSFCSMLPDMDTEVARMAFEKFPDFAKMSSDIMLCFKEMVGSAIKDNAANMREFNASCDAIIYSLNSLLHQKRIKKKERAVIINNILQVLQIKAQKDKDNKEWLGNIIKTAGSVAVTVIGVAGAILGLKFFSDK